MVLALLIWRMRQALASLVALMYSTTRFWTGSAGSANLCAKTSAWCALTPARTLLLRSQHLRQQVCQSVSDEWLINRRDGKVSRWGVTSRVLSGHPIPFLPSVSSAFHQITNLRLTSANNLSPSHRDGNQYWEGMDHRNPPESGSAVTWKKTKKRSKRKKVERKREKSVGSPTRLLPFVLPCRLENVCPTSSDPGKVRHTHVVGPFDDTQAFQLIVPGLPHSNI